MPADESDQWAALAEHAQWFVRRFLVPSAQPRLLSLLEYGTRKKVARFSEELSDLTAAVSRKEQREVTHATADDLVRALRGEGFPRQAIVISERTGDSSLSVDVEQWVVAHFGSLIGYLLIAPDHTAALLQGEEVYDTLLLAEQPQHR